MTEPRATDPRTCPWCSAIAHDDDTQCRSCGAALAQRESIGEVAIPGVTTVDAALKDYAGRPMRLRGPSPSQGVASGVVVAAAAGGPIGLAALGGIAAIAAAEYMAANRESGPQLPLDAVGRPSEAALQALRRLETEGDAASEAAAEPAPGAPGDAPPQADNTWADLPNG